MANFTSQVAMHVDMGTAIITNADSSMPILGTWGIYTCVGIAIYNPCSKEAMLMHVSTEVKMDLLRATIKEISCDEGDKLLVFKRS